MHVPTSQPAWHDLSRVQIDYTIWLHPTDSAPVLKAAKGQSYFRPCTDNGRGKAEVKEATEHGGQPITWDPFWAKGSRFMHDGAARIRLDLRLPTNVGQLLCLLSC